MAPVGFPSGLGISEKTIHRQLVEQTQSLIDTILAVTLAETGHIIGQAKIKSPDPDGLSITDIKLFPEYWRRRFGTEIKQALVSHLFENTSCTAIEATPNLTNLPSIRMQEKAGYLRLGRGRWEPDISLKGNALPVDYWIYRVFKGLSPYSDIRYRRYRYTGIVPAAGLSARMNRFKPLLPWPPDEPDTNVCVIQSTIQSLMNAGIDPIIVITGFRSEEICDRLRDWPVEIESKSADSRAPMSHSIARAIPFIASSSAVLVLPADHPAVNPETIRRLVGFHESEPGKIHIPSYHGRSGHPTLFPNEALGMMADPHLKEGLRTVIKNSGLEVVRHDFSDSGILKNLDYPQDYFR